MGFFKKIFGGSSFDDERKEGDELFARGEFVDARIAYERALDKKKSAPADAVEHCEERVAACLDRMAELRIEEAQKLLEEGHADLAEVELKNALETAASEEIAKRARLELEKLERQDARERASAAVEMSDDDHWALLAGNWEPAQMEEYDEYGDEFRDALLALHKGDAKEAREGLEAILEEAEEPRYLWLEVGRARIATEDYAAAEEALRELLDALEEDEGIYTQLAAHEAIAAIRDKEEDEEGAIAELQRAIDAFPDDPRAFFVMGRYLRSKDYAEEAVKVLEAAVPFLDEDRPDWRYLEELGLACKAAEEDEKAAAYLDRVIAFHVSVRRMNAEPDLPPATAIARAKLHEDAGELEKAADLYRTLARGGDRENHLTYHREAARLLIELELFDEARRMLTRALALTDEQPDVRAEIEAKLEELE